MKERLPSRLHSFVVDECDGGYLAYGEVCELD